MKKLIKTSTIVAALFTSNIVFSEENVRLIVTKKDGTSTSTKSANSRAPSKMAHTISNDISVPESEVEMTIQSLKSDPEVIAVERDVIVYQTNSSTVTEHSHSVYQQSASAENDPSDPAFRYQSYFSPRGDENLTGKDILSVWALGEQVIRPKIAVFDGGFLEEGRFADMQPEYNYSFATRGGSQYGDSAYNDEEELECEDGHGAGVYGVIGAISDNDEGMAGIVDAEMYMVQVMRCGQGSMYDAANALRWAAGDEIEGVPSLKEPVDIANFSMGGQASCPIFFQSAIDFAISRGVKVFIAAGNDDVEASTFTPANCQGATVTGALDRDTGDKADFSNFGDRVDVMSQGTDIGALSTFDSGYGIWSGTSFASPITAGIYGLVKAHAPGVSNDVLDKLMMMTLEPISNAPICDSIGCGKGMVSAKRFADAAIRYEQGNFAEVKSTLTETALCDSTPYLMATGVKARLCESYTVAIDADLFPVVEGEFVIYRLYQWEQDETFNSDNSKLIYEGTDTEYIVSDLDLSLSTGLVRCANGACDNSIVLPVSLDNTGRPVACNN